MARVIPCGESVVLHYDPETDTYSTIWGEITPPLPTAIPGTPDHIAAGHQTLATLQMLEGLLTRGPERFDQCEGTLSATTDGSRVFLHLEAENGHWVWLMFPAHWSDGSDPDGEWFVGVFPD